MTIENTPAATTETPPATPAVVAVTPTPEEDFSAAFDVLDDIANKPAATPAVTTEAAAETPPETPAGVPSPETPPAETTAATTETPPVVTIPETPPVETTPAAAAETPPADLPVYSDAEKTALAKYQTDWPEVATGEQLIRKAEYRELVRHVFSEISKEFGPAIEYYHNRSDRDQYSDVVALVPDYDQVREKVIAWIDTQPAYLKAAYKQTAETGSPEDIADMIARYKKEAGIITTTVTLPATPPAPPAAKPGEARAVAALTVVKSGRTEPVTTSDPNDFDGAFEQFAVAK